MPDRSTVALKALREIKELIGRPVGLSAKLSEWSTKQDLDEPLSVPEFLDWLQPTANETHVRQYFHGMISLWDYRPEFDWSNGTEPSSDARRHLICSLLKLSGPEEEQVSRLFPVYPKIDQPIRITADEPGTATWYDEQRREQSSSIGKATNGICCRNKAGTRRLLPSRFEQHRRCCDLRDPWASIGPTGGCSRYVHQGKCHFQA